MAPPSQASLAMLYFAKCSHAQMKINICALGRLLEPYLGLSICHNDLLLIHSYEARLRDPRGAEPLYRINIVAKQWHLGHVLWRKREVLCGQPSLAKLLQLRINKSATTYFLDKGGCICDKECS